MEKGTLNELVLTRSVTKHIRKHNKNLVSGTGVGDDYAGIIMQDEVIIWSEGWGRTPALSWCKAMNNLATSGAKPLGVRLQLMLPVATEEAIVKNYMKEFNQFADEEKVQILGGNTQISEAYLIPTFTVSVVGAVGAQAQMTKKAKEGYQIVMTKYAGILGSDILVKEKEDVLNSRLSKGYIQGGYFGETMYRVDKEASIAVRLSDNVCYMHDVSYGGVYGALWQLGVKLGKGMCINHYDIPIRQETIEFCEIFDINPYMLEGTGSLLIVAKDGTEVVKSLQEEGIVACIIGTITDTKDRYVSLEDSVEKRFLAPVKGDEIYKIVSAY